MNASAMGLRSIAQRERTEHQRPELADAIDEAANTIERLTDALTEIASHDTGMRSDFSAGARQAKIAMQALGVD